MCSVLQFLPVSCSESPEMFRYTHPYCKSAYATGAYFFCVGSSQFRWNHFIHMFEEPPCLNIVCFCSLTNLLTSLMIAWSGLNVQVGMRSTDTSNERVNTSNWNSSSFIAHLLVSCEWRCLRLKSFSRVYKTFFLFRCNTNTTGADVSLHA